MLKRNWGEPMSYKKISLLILILILATTTFLLEKNIKVFSKLVQQNIKPSPSAVPTYKKIAFGELALKGSSRLIADIIKQQSFDKKYGIEIDYKYFQPDQIPLALISGSIEIGQISPTQAARVNLEGKKIKIFYPLMMAYCPVLVQPDSKAKTIEDLRNKKLTTMPVNSGTHTLLATIINKKGWEVDKYFQVTNNPPLVSFSLFLKKDFDVLVDCGADVDIAKLIANKQAKILTTLQDLWQEETKKDSLILTVGLGSYQDWLEQHPNEAKAITQAYKEAFDYLKDHPEVYDNFLNEYTKEEVEGAKVLSQKIFPLNNRWNDEFIQSLNFFLNEATKASVLEELPPENIFIIL